MYTNDPAKGNRITRIQQDSIGFAQSLSAAVEQNYQWSSGRGLQIVATAIISIEYDENTRELLEDVQRADALVRRARQLQPAGVGRGRLPGGGQNTGSAGLVGIGMAAGATGLGGLQQPVPGIGAQSTPPPAHPRRRRPRPALRPGHRPRRHRPRRIRWRS